MSSEANYGAGALATNNDWTVMLYITADGILTNFAVESLKQLNKAVSRGADERDKPSVKVAAHFSFPGGATDPAAAAAGAPASQIARKYIFPFPYPAEELAQRTSQRSEPGHVETLPPNVELSVKADKSKNVDKPAGADKTHEAKVSVKKALKAFLNDVYSNPQLNQSGHYALILWGHGPELLLRPPANNLTGDSVSLYLTPEELREVLTECKPPNGRPLDIIGFDACYMSMLEMADELKGLADFMVASQDEVPDLSFPYDTLVALLREHGGQPDLLLEEGVKAYVATYQDCICNNTTEMNPVQLSALNLKNCDMLKDAVYSLACALLKAKDDEGLACGLIEARESSKDYAGGLYVDLYDFCVNLSGNLGKLKDEAKRKAIANACEAVQAALNVSKNKDSLILVNSSVNDSEDKNAPKILFDSPDPRKQSTPTVGRNHGISIYLPYLTEEQFAQVQRPLAKGGTLSGKGGFSEALQGAGTEYLMYARRDLILDTESYYRRLKLADETNWYAFITEVWTRALMDKLPAGLDYHYSAQQAWMNVARGPGKTAKPCP